MFGWPPDLSNIFRHAIVFCQELINIPASRTNMMSESEWERDQQPWMRDTSFMNKKQTTLDFLEVQILFMMAFLTTQCFLCVNRTVPALWSISKGRGCKWNTMIIYNCFSKSS